MNYKAIVLAGGESKEMKTGKSNVLCEVLATL